MCFVVVIGLSGSTVCVASIASFFISLPMYASGIDLVSQSTALLSAASVDPDRLVLVLSLLL